MISRSLAVVLLACVLVLTACGSEIDVPGGGSVSVPGTEDLPDLPSVSVPTDITNSTLAIALEQNGFTYDAAKKEYKKNDIVIVMNDDGSPKEVKYGNEFLDCNPTTESVLLALTTSAFGGTDEASARELCAIN